MCTVTGTNEINMIHLHNGILCSCLKECNSINREQNNVHTILPICNTKGKNMDR